MPPRPTVYSNRNKKLQFVTAKIKTKLLDVDFRAVVYCLCCYILDKLTVFLKPSLFLFLHFVIMPRFLINFYLYKFYIYIFVKVFLATTVKEDKEYIVGELTPKTMHCFRLLLLIQTVVNVKCLKNAFKEFGVHSVSLQLDQKMDFPSKQFNAVKNGLISKLLLNDWKWMLCYLYQRCSF